MTMRRYIYNTLHPEIYHGHNRRPPFFEGWYYKLVDAHAQTAWAIIPGIYKGINPQHSQAFIMTLDGRTHQATFHAFPLDAFHAHPDQFDILIANNHFTANSLALALPNLHGQLTFTHQTPWPVRWHSPGIMGWYAWVPMECYHGLVSMDHQLHGHLTTPDGVIDFEGGRGYLEKDWGQSFPQTWIWLQANHFDTVGTSVTASIARIPFYGTVFPGFIIGLWHQGTLHRFTTYVGAKLQKVAVTPHDVTIIVRNRTHQLTLTAQRGPTALLHMPTKKEGMVPAVNESVGATVTLQLHTNTGQLLYESNSPHAGLEIEGDIDILIV
ncbi:MAG TPA: tocopherol cyclase family protein [Anaerolineae bacterium]|nr:tocopherol cyclase family protein [Anaerolineae bacterium]